MQADVVVRCRAAVRVTEASIVQTVLDKSHRLLLNMAAKMPNLVPRMDAQECLKRTVCEAHNKPGRYGLIGIALQLFFPPFRPGDAEGIPSSPLQLAARYGREPSADCGRQYDGCFLDPLQTLQAAVNYFLRRPGSSAVLSSTEKPGIVWGTPVVEPITADKRRNIIGQQLSVLFGRRQGLTRGMSDRRTSRLHCTP
ncbi:hypothetical protein HPB52_008948 [Rhipicephalus sanguineus]|uniref:Uncharacterized protein n=1 Tax=Rhipicephalus sanguineus TaxID=34632 RepID=A0A9D4PTH1_RHISA|nr:hypothetical protein HPB52_008948 [Rhipicephalus sanguineus]